MYSMIDELLARLSVCIRAHGVSNSPMMDNMEWYVIKKRCEFEPHGRASETWETIWYLEFPWCPHYWRHLSEGWREGNPDLHVVCKANTLKKVLLRGIAFLEETKEQGLVLGEHIHEKRSRTASQDKQEV